jgi:Rieske Fe-S protein
MADENKDCKDNKPSRREFISKSLKIIGGVMLIPLASACNTASVIEGKSSTYDIPEDNTATVYPDDKLVMSRLGNNVYAHSTVCTHLGCIVGYSDEAESIDCPCHGSKFALDGKKTEGPAGRGLDRYKAIITSDGKVKVDFSNVYKEGKEGYKEAVATVN